LIRPASTSDLQRVLALVMEMYRRSEFAQRGCTVNQKIVRALLLGGVQRHGGQHAGSMLFNVAEFRGQVEGFMLSQLQPVYAIGDQLEAFDIFLYCSKKAPKVSVGLLIDAYAQWAQSCPKVVDIALSWTDVVRVDGRKLARLYQRKQFRKRGEIFVRAGK
jgi:hypothetical protein